MFPVRRTRPSTSLAPFIHAYEERVAQISEALVVRPLPARTDQLIEFFLGDLYRIRTSGGTISTTPRAVAVGIQTRRGVDILLSGDLRTFAIKFTPTGFQALFGTPQTMLTDVAAPAADVAAFEIANLADPLAEAPDMDRRIALVEERLQRHLSQRNLEPDPIAWASAVMVRCHGRVRIDALVDQSNMSARQFERRFQVQVGTGPKRYTRILRFQHALALREAHPAWSWTAIAHETGFADQSHMIHEFRALSGEGPKTWLTAATPSRETLVSEINNFTHRGSASVPGSPRADQ